MAATCVQGITILRELVEALNINRPITALYFDADCKNLARVNVEFFMNDEDTKRFVKVFSRYHLVPVEPDAPDEIKESHP